ncbi:MAG TPA: hypothetical protein VM290_10720 [Gaiellaceae bacterium]|nr:hypothetical protein [Gaiellaceae bacterium]
MTARLLPAALVLAALAADAAGRHGLAGYLLVAGVPAAAAGALVLFGRLVELAPRTRGEAWIRFESSLAALALVLVLVAAAARSHAAEGASLPPLTASAVVAALAVYLLQALTALTAPRPRPARRRRTAAAAAEAAG